MLNLSLNELKLNAKNRGIKAYKINYIKIIFKLLSIRKASEPIKN